VRFETGFDAGPCRNKLPWPRSTGNAICMTRRHLRIWRLTIAAKLDVFRGPRLDGIATIRSQSLARSRAKAKISNKACVKQLTTQAQGHAVS
jgi:hypothetical protein